jgi:hypothetical protein
MSAPHPSPPQGASMSHSINNSLNKAMSASPICAAPVSRSARQEPWVWLVVGIPALTVVAGLFTWWIAAQRVDSDVADQHYKRGLAINRVLEREQAAQQAGIGADLEFGPDGQLVLRLHTLAGVAHPEALQMLLTHPVDARRDLRLALIMSPDGRYRASLNEAAREFAGQWGITIEGPGWRITGARLALKAGAYAEIGHRHRP